VTGAPGVAGVPVGIVERHCPICNDANVGFPWRTVRAKSLARCKGCGFAWFPRGQYDAASVRQQYLADKTSPTEYYDRAAQYDEATFLLRLRRLARLLNGSGGRIVDVGCTVGTFLRTAQREGFTPIGVEPNPQAAARARGQGLEVHTGFFDQAAVERIGRADAVHMGDVIEHVFDPVELLRRAASVLRPGGVLMVVTPDIESVMGRLLQVKPDEHLIYFTRRSLELAARTAGFEDVGVQRWGRRRSMAAMPYSTTFSTVGKNLVRVLAAPGVRTAAELGLFHFFKDELLLTARRPPA
jgi:2-polyprenyl-3-methyl-5-hydroxy-6-metoxy-1,4-benzoquinol methylase